jgi:hypothetical protein
VTKRLTPWIFAAAAAACAFVSLGSEPARAANDPSILWQTIETPHFRITYESQSREIAERVADLAEDIHARLAPAVGWSPGERTELLLSDQTDSANGSASALPYNAIRLNITAPDDLSPLGDAEDWFLELVTHEYTHILHTDHMGGLPAVVNAVLGKTLAPNQVEPRWMLEGLAVFEESSKTSGGRLRSSLWNMYMRADVLGDNVAPLDVFSNPVRRWPQGNIWYLYGSFFMRWIAETYGEDAIRRMIDDYGRQIVPYGINRSLRRATGRTFEELYPAWVDTLRRTYGAQVAAAKARGLRQGVRLTTSGQNSKHPRWIPNGAWPGHGGDLLYNRDDGHETAGLYILPVSRDPMTGRVTGAREKDRENMIRISGEASASFLPDGGVVWDSLDQYNNLFYFNDLFRAPPGTHAPRGMEGRTIRLTQGFRAADPDVSPDGRRVAFTTNHRGTTYLQVAVLDPDGVHDVVNLVPSKRYEQAFTPRWSPDNRHLAYSAWTAGGYRDIRIVDTKDGSYKEIAHDRAVDGGACFSPDGRWLFFHSDRTLGIYNVFAYEVATGRVRQVTNVTTGAFQPEPSPDGKTLAYVGYGTTGFDLYAMPLDESTWLDAMPYEDDYPAPTPPPPHRKYANHEYDPVGTLWPRRYSVQLAPGNFGNAATIGIAGSDLVGHHSYAISLTSEFERPEPQGSITYAYGRLPVDIGVSGYRSISPRGGLALGSQKPLWVGETVGIQTAASYNLPRQFDNQTVSVAYSAARTGGELGIDGKLDPYETPQIPQRGIVGIAHFGWAYNNVERWLWSVGGERGFAAGANLDVTDPWLGSEFTGYSASGNLAVYYPMPWLRHHDLGLHAGAGTSGGSYPGKGAFYIGGFVDLPVIDSLRNTLIQGGVVLRGYPTVAEAGRNYALFNAEYRFPIVDVERGPSTLPIFLNRVTGAAFVDYGSAFDDAYTAKFKTGAGGELWFDFTLGYLETFTFRLGYARGLSSGGIDKPYFIAAIPF